MNDILKYYVNSFSNATKSLKKKGIFIEKPWVLIDDDGEIQKLIFKKDKGLILSKNGKVSEGFWDYYPEAKALLIDRGKDKLLLKEQFIDDNVLILKKDGTENDFFALANENSLPDLNIPKYLNSLKCTEFNISVHKLMNGNILQIYNGQDSYYYDYSGCKVEQIDNKYNSLSITDGYFMSKSRETTFYVKNGIIDTVSKNLIAESPEGYSFEIENGVNYNKKLNYDKRVTINGKIINKQIITDSENTIYELKESTIINILFLITYELANGFTIKIEQSDNKKIKKGDEIVYTEPISPIPDGKYRIKGTLKWIKIKDSIIE